mmetsp:Transcript_148605/g.378049  ORF Transcript_148605/g.378049 Transcript_148605/m.378049 type:complete len:225 (+) Transcript_148605:68-742(+)
MPTEASSCVEQHGSSDGRAGVVYSPGDILAHSARMMVRGNLLGFGSLNALLRNCCALRVGDLGDDRGSTRDGDGSLLYPGLQAKRVAGVCKDPTHAADIELLWVPSIRAFASDACLWVFVYSAKACLLVFDTGPVAQNTDVALLAIVWAPRVADEPKVLPPRLVGAITCKQHCVVHFGVPRAFVKDACLILAPATRIHRDDDWTLLSDSLHQGLQPVLWEAVEA